MNEQSKVVVGVGAAAYAAVTVAAHAELGTQPILLPVDYTHQATVLGGSQTDLLRGFTALVAASRRGHVKTLAAIIRLRALEPEGLDAAINALDSSGQVSVPLSFQVYNNKCTSTCNEIQRCPYSPQKAKQTCTVLYMSSCSFLQ